MLNLSRNHMAVLLLVLAATLFSAGAAMAQPDGHAATPDDAHQTTDTHGDESHAADTHAADPHAADTHGDAAHGDDHGGGHGSTPHMANVFAILSQWLPAPVANFIAEFVDPIFSYIVIALLVVFFLGVKKSLSSRKPGRAQMAAEILVGGLYSMFEAIIGPSARRYTPFLGTLFIFIWVNNLFGMVPGGHAATSAFNTTTFALGLMTFCFVQFYAVRLNGIGGYLHHMAGSPKTGMDWGFSILLFPLHLLGELIKPVSLALRLFGNIFGEDTLVATMVILGWVLTKVMVGIFVEVDAIGGFLPGIPLQLPFYFLGLLSSTIQATVFTLLATVYIALWLPHDEEHGH